MLYHLIRRVAKDVAAVKRTCPCKMPFTAISDEISNVRILNNVGVHEKNKDVVTKSKMGLRKVDSWLVREGKTKLDLSGEGASL